ncbi:hypothetical protein [Candidatus Palauibacter sp.]|uniref:hypothetical protein n=1 Tax=Candidatus Palauibacter sp. TaxID=3101350 RepID=UPI003B59121B
MTVGFDRKIRAGWLDVTARLAAAGLSPSTIRDELDEVLDGEVSGEGPHSARGKTKTVLLHVWVTVPQGVVPLRDEALGVVGSGGGAPDLRPLHWGMCLTTYPFFRDVAAITGRLLSLQGSVTLAMVSRRIAERCGARSTVLRASQRVVRSMVEWGALSETGQRGVFRSGPPIGVLDAVPGDGWLAGWLLEAALFASGRQSMRVESLARHPMLFPFQTGATARDATARTRLDLFREGAGEDVVAWKDFPAAHG